MNATASAFSLLLDEHMLVVHPRGGRIALCAVSNLIRSEGGELLATGPAPEGSESGVYRLRVRTPALGALVRCLDECGHQVLGVGPEGGIQGTGRSPRPRAHFVRRGGR